LKFSEFDCKFTQKTKSCFTDANESLLLFKFYIEIISVLVILKLRCSAKNFPLGI